MNPNILVEDKTVSYSSIRNAVDKIAELPTSFLDKADISDSFLLILIHPKDKHGNISWALNFFTITTMTSVGIPIGDAASCKIFERFAKPLVLVFEDTYKVKRSTNLLDDSFYNDETD